MRKSDAFWLTVASTVLSQTRLAAAAEEPPAVGSSPIVTLLFLAGFVFILYFMIFALRNARKNQPLLLRNMEKSEAHLIEAHEHMKRSEAQMSELSSKLSRVIALLESIESGQHRQGE